MVLFFMSENNSEKRYLTIKVGVKLFERLPCGAAGGIRHNLGQNSLRRIVTSGGSVLEVFSVSKAMLPCLQNILCERMCEVATVS